MRRVGPARQALLHPPEGSAAICGHLGLCLARMRPQDGLGPQRPVLLPPPGRRRTLLVPRQRCLRAWSAEQSLLHRHRRSRFPRLEPSLTCEPAHWPSTRASRCAQTESVVVADAVASLRQSTWLGKAPVMPRARPKTRGTGRNGPGRSLAPATQNSAACPPWPKRDRGLVAVFRGAVVESPSCRTPGRRCSRAWSAWKGLFRWLLAKGLHGSPANRRAGGRGRSRT